MSEAHAPKSFLPPLKNLGWRDASVWLANGLRDLRASPGIAAFATPYSVSLAFVWHAYRGCYGADATA